MAITSQSQSFHTKLEDDDAEKLERLARENDRSVAAELRRAVRFYLKAQEKS